MQHQLQEYICNPYAMLANYHYCLTQGRYALYALVQHQYGITIALPCHNGTLPVPHYRMATAGIRAPGGRTLRARLELPLKNIAPKFLIIVFQHNEANNYKNQKYCQRYVEIVNSHLNAIRRPYRGLEGFWLGWQRGIPFIALSGLLNAFKRYFKINGWLGISRTTINTLSSPPRVDGITRRTQPSIQQANHVY